MFSNENPVATNLFLLRDFSQIQNLHHIKAVEHSGEVGVGVFSVSQNLGDVEGMALEEGGNGEAVSWEKFRID